jgi:hypothetical protein
MKISNIPNYINPKAQAILDDMAKGTLMAKMKESRTSYTEYHSFNVKHDDQDLKKDAGKNRLDLVPPEWVLSIGKVLTFGISKGYGEESWRKVEKRRYVASTLRHFYAFLSGEKTDPESGLHHLAHVLTNVGFLLSLDEECEKKKLDKDKYFGDNGTNCI